MLTVSSGDGTAIAYELRGDGPATILVGGALSNRESAAGLATILSARFSVLAYDRRGRGDSGDTPPYAVEREIDDLATLIDLLGAAGGLRLRSFLLEQLPRAPSCRRRRASDRATRVVRTAVHRRRQSPPVAEGFRLQTHCPLLVGPERRRSRVLPPHGHRALPRGRVAVARVPAVAGYGSDRAHARV